MLLRTILLRRKSRYKYDAIVICTECGHENSSSSYASKSIVVMTTSACTNCSAKLENHELLNKNSQKRLEYHERV